MFSLGGRLRDGLRYRHAVPDTIENGVLFHPGFSRPFGCGLGLAAARQLTIIAAIPRLFSSRYPCAIFWGVASVDVFSLDGQVIRVAIVQSPLSKPLVILPFRAYCDTSPPVVCIRRSVFSSASSPHFNPNLIQALAVSEPIFHLPHSRPDMLPPYLQYEATPPRGICQRHYPHLWLRPLANCPCANGSP